MNEYVKLGNVSKVGDTEDQTYSHYFLAHHPWFKESTTPKLRVMIGAFAKTNSGL